MKSEIRRIKELTDHVDGWLHDTEGELLYRLAKGRQGKGVIVEIGSWKGKSTIWLARGSQEGKKIKVYAIDPHTGSAEHKESLGTTSTFREFQSNIQTARVEDIVVPLVKTSEEASRNFPAPVEFVFIDGAHEYDFVKLDFEVWSPRIIQGGIIAFHDTIGWPGPKQVVKEFIVSSNSFRNVRFVHSIVYAQKVAKNSTFDRLRNRYVLLLLSLYQLLSWRWLPKVVQITMIRTFSIIQ